MFSSLPIPSSARHRAATAYKKQLSNSVRVMLLAVPPLMFLATALRTYGSPGNGTSSSHTATTLMSRVREMSAMGDDSLNEVSLREQIRSACRLCSRSVPTDISTLRSYGPAYSSIIVSHRLKVVYVPVFKVATTSTMWQIAYLESNAHILNTTGDDLEIALHDMDHPAWYHHAIYRWDDARIEQVLQDPSYLKFGFVRDPYDRLISAYIDKIMRPSIDSPEYQDQMYSLFGDDQPSRAAGNITKPSFESFVRSIAHVLKQPRVQRSHNHVLYENNRSRRDLHWRPQLELLHPDIIPFDFVGKFDSLAYDRLLVMQWMYQHTSRRMRDDVLHKRHSTDPRQKKNFLGIIRNNQDLRQLIVDTYRQDFETFNFPIELPPPAPL
ncbi:Carbohydrate sulfotransferase 9 [Gracilariopsis chorda]|uniref:Carbohydrate sulfotransferase 9 n=1 Tax=Gracilariopsis chorda TaxID=448386 RepID=A0A2V3J7C1_9FLOR|nr:Carbohydrate sulfotransferase 9 [Gracilariopsis chorda]|eukprot:PXF49857.1 Carbohydrate sulfotransferase 9 [Gracilariopsis chorda]